MIVCDNIHKHPEEAHKHYWSNLECYDKDTSKYLMKLGCTKPSETEPSAIQVLMSEDEIDAMSKHYGVKQAYDYAVNVSHGNICVVLQFEITLDDEFLNWYITTVDAINYIKYKGSSSITRSHDDIPLTYFVEVVRFITQEEYHGLTMEELKEKYKQMLLEEFHKLLEEENKWPTI